MRVGLQKGTALQSTTGTSTCLTKASSGHRSSESESLNLITKERTTQPTGLMGYQAGYHMVHGLAKLY